MRDLVNSKPDKWSPLSGKELIARKVELIVWMDMMYNFGCAQHDTDNWLGPDTGCRGSAQVGVGAWGGISRCSLSIYLDLGLPPS